MSYTYSIFHPEKEEVEYVSTVFNKEDVFRLVKDFSWNGKLDLLESLLEADICYNSSLYFTCQEDNYSFCLTAARKRNKQLEFSLCFNLKVTHKPFFGLLGEREKMQVIDKWGFTENDALEYLKIFLEKDYEELEVFMSI